MSSTAGMIIVQSPCRIMGWLEENIALHERLKRARRETRVLRLTVRRQKKDLKRLFDELERERVKAVRLLHKAEGARHARKSGGFR